MSTSMRSPEEVRKLAEHYRSIRKAVYELATAPSDGDPHAHDQNKATLKGKITYLCNTSILDCYRGTAHETALALWDQMWRINRYAGINNVVASKEIADIAGVFGDYRVFADSSWNIVRSGHKKVEAGAAVEDFLNRTGPFEECQTIGNLPKLCKIVETARKLKEFMETKPPEQPVLNFVTGGHAEDDIWGIHQHLLGIGYTSHLTALHLMMDLGFQVIKPDIIISQLFLEWGWLKEVCNLPADLSFKDLRGRGKHGSRYQYTRPEAYKPVIDLSRQIVAATDQQDLLEDIGWVTQNPLREFDIFMVKYGQIAEPEWGITRSLFSGEQENNVSCSGHSV